MCAHIKTFHFVYISVAQDHHLAAEGHDHGYAGQAQAVPPQLSQRVQGLGSVQG